MATEDQLRQAVDTVMAAVSTAVTAQASAERAAAEVDAGLKKIREYEARRPIIKELTREIGVGADPERLAAIEAAVLEIKSGRGSKEQTPIIDASRLDGMDRSIAEIKRLIDAKRTSTEVVTSVASDIIDRVTELEKLVLEMVTTPRQLAEHLHMTAEIMTAMDERFHAMRAADQSTIEMHRQASEHAALAQGGLTAMVNSLRVDIDHIAVAVADLRNHIAMRDQYRAQIISSRRGAA